MKQWVKNIAAGMIAAVISATMIGSRVIPVSAEETNYPATNTNCSITINNVSGKHIYEAYQIFSGDVYETTQDGTTTRVLSNVDWGDALHVGQNLKNKNLIQHLQSQDALNNTAITNLTYSSLHDQVSSSPFEVLDAIKNAVGDPQDTVKAQAVAKAFFHTIDSTPSSTPSRTGSNEETSSTTITISRLKPGYYIVIDKDTTQSSQHRMGQSSDQNLNDMNGAFTSVILQVAGKVSISSKSDVPTLTKQVWNPYKSTPGWDDYTYAGTDDTITYKLTGTLPSNFDNYYSYVNFNFYDHPSIGISYNSDSIKVYAGTEDLTTEQISDDYTDVTELFNTSSYDSSEYEGEISPGGLDVILKADLRKSSVYQFHAGTKIIVLYTAKLNKFADVGQGSTLLDSYEEDLYPGKGNSNLAELKYSNNPNMTSSDPDYDEVGMTPQVEATVFTFKFKPTKYHDEVKTGNELPGAIFTLYKNSKSRSNIYGFGVSDSEGKIVFYKAAVSDTIPTEEEYSTVKESSGSTYYIYKMPVPEQSEEGEEESESSSEPAELLLATGTYILAETTTPDGYNTMADRTIVLGANTEKDSGGQTSLKSVTVTTSVDGKNVSEFSMKSDNMAETTSDEGTPVENPNGIIVGNIINNTGSLLPNTGGIGTTIFYVVGGVIIVGAIILLVMRRKKDE